MKILIDCSNIRTGGAIQNGVSLLANAVSDTAHQWSAIVSGELAEQIPSEWESGFHAFRRLEKKTKAVDVISHARSASQFEKAIGPDLVYSLFGPVYWNPIAKHVVGFAKPQFLYPEVVRRFQRNTLGVGRWISTLKLAYQKSRFRKADYLIAETETVRKRAIDAIGFSAKSFFVVPNCYSPIFADYVSSFGERADTNDVLRIFVPTSFYPHKNLAVLPRVARILKDIARTPFVFVVTLSEHEANVASIIKEVHTLGVATSFSWIGPVKQSDLAALYMQANVVFLPTLMECSTSVYPECFLSRTPLVTSDKDFARELCGDAALYCDPLDPASCAHALLSVLSDADIREALSKAGEIAFHQGYLSPEGRWRALKSVLNQCGESHSGGSSMREQ